MSRLSSKISRSISVVMPGFIDDVYITQIKESHVFHRNETNLSELCSSIQQKGLLHPLVVRTNENHYEIVAGNRRLRACKLLGWKKIACHVVELDDKNAFEVSLVENMHRKRLSPIEEANAFKAYMSDFGWGGISELASQIGKSKSYISKRIKLLDLPSDIIQSILASKIDVSLAEELFKINNQNRQSLLANLIADRRLSLRSARKLIKDQDERDLSFDSNGKYEYVNHYRLEQRSFDKSITVFRIAMKTLVEVINNVEHDWIVQEVLMHHKSVLHTQIDLLLKEKAKLQL